MALANRTLIRIDLTTAPDNQEEIDLNKVSRVIFIFMKKNCFFFKTYFLKDRLTILAFKIYSKFSLSNIYNFLDSFWSEDIQSFSGPYWLVFKISRNQGGWGGLLSQSLFILQN